MSLKLQEIKKNLLLWESSHSEDKFCLLLELYRLVLSCSSQHLSDGQKHFLESITGSFLKGWETSHDNTSRSQKGLVIFCRGSDGWGWWKKLLIQAIRKLWWRTAGLWITQQTQWVHNSDVLTGHLHSWNITFGFFNWQELLQPKGLWALQKQLAALPSHCKSILKGKNVTCHSSLAHGKICELPHYN